MAYQRLNWLNKGETGAIPINKTNLNHMDEGIYNIYNDLYPVGHIIVRDDETDLSNWLGFTWQKVFAGKMLIGVDDLDDDFKNIGATGGEKEVTLTVEQIPPKQISTTKNVSAGATDGYPMQGSYDVTGTFNFGGGGEAHNNMPPYQVVVWWKRTA